MLMFSLLSLSSLSSRSLAGSHGPQFFFSALVTLVRVTLLRTPEASQVGRAGVAGVRWGPGSPLFSSISLPETPGVPRTMVGTQTPHLDLRLWSGLAVWPLCLSFSISISSWSSEEPRQKAEEHWSLREVAPRGPGHTALS
jgi:hypothetical protein